MFIADAINGNIYHFKLNPQRTGLLLHKGPLADGQQKALNQIIFGRTDQSTLQTRFTIYSYYG
jgi:hypothetical protein